jgi:hypothetical protein
MGGPQSVIGPSAEKISAAHSFNLISVLLWFFSLSHFLVSMLAQAVRSLNCVWEISSMNFVRDSDCPECFLMCPQSLYENSGIIHYIKPWRLSLKFLTHKSSCHSNLILLIAPL